jgi:DMSO/TMAO reductase YedYZ molybdopterin-dependent catalytic subunit
MHPYRHTSTSLSVTHTPRLFTFLMTVALMLATVASTGLTAFAQATPATPTSSDSIAISGEVKTSGSLSVADLQALPNEHLDVTFTASGKPQNHTFTGTPLLGVLDHVGLVTPKGGKNPLLGVYLVVTAKDGYQVVISGGELDPSFGNTPMYLAWEQDGKALAGDDGPIRLVVPDDTKGGRYVNGIVSIDVFTVAGPAATPAA